MNCPSCGAPMHLKADMESFRCDYCQSVYFPEKNDDGVRVLDEKSDQECPVCSLPLANAAIGKMRILYCTKCHGMLLAMPVFQGLISELESESGDKSTVVPVAGDHEDLTRKIACPHCHHAMDAHFYAGPGNVVIDSCENCCLIWLDRGELMRIVHASDGTISYTQPLPGDFDAAPVAYDPIAPDPITRINPAVDIAGTVIVDAIDALFN